jgi:hypothetical protein
MIRRFFNSESRRIVFAWKDPTSSESIDPRRGVSARDINSLSTSTVVLPHNCDPMGCVLATNTQAARYKVWSNMLKANQAYSGDCITILKFGTKWSW